MACLIEHLDIYELVRIIYMYLLLSLAMYRYLHILLCAVSYVYGLRIVRVETFHMTLAAYGTLRIISVAGLAGSWLTQAAFQIMVCRLNIFSLSFIKALWCNCFFFTDVFIAMLMCAVILYALWTSGLYFYLRSGH